MRTKIPMTKVSNSERGGMRPPRPTPRSATVQGARGPWWSPISVVGSSNPGPYAGKLVHM